MSSYIPSSPLKPLQGPQRISQLGRNGKVKYKRVAKTYCCETENIYDVSRKVAILIASEHRAWILFYCLPVLGGLLPDVFCEHFTLLVCSMHLLLIDQIALESLSRTENAR